MPLFSISSIDFRLEHWAQQEIQGPDKHTSKICCVKLSFELISIGDFWRMYVTNYAEAQSSRNTMMGDANALAISWYVGKIFKIYLD